MSTWFMDCMYCITKRAHSVCSLFSEITHFWLFLFYILVVKLILNSVPGSIKKLFKCGFVKRADTLKVCLCLCLPVIDFTPLSLTIVFWVHLGERFRTKSAWEVHPCKSTGTHTSCLQSCTVNVLFDPQLNIRLIESSGKNLKRDREGTRTEAGCQTKDGGLGRGRRGDGKEVVKKGTRREEGVIK